MANLEIGIILGSIRTGRRGEGFAKWIVEIAKTRPALSVELLDLRDYPLHGYDYKEMPSMIEGTYQDEASRKWSEKIHAKDGYVIVTPEYNHGYPGQLKNAIDHVMKGWWYKAVGFVSYGGTACGARAVGQLRGVASEVRMVTIRTEVNIRLIGLTHDDNGAPTDPLYTKLAGGMLDQLAWWAQVAKDGRAATPPPQ